MKLLLDENLDWRLERDLADHTVSSVQRIGWAGITNGELIRRTEKEFDARITMDTGLVEQQNLAGRDVIVIVLRAKSNRLSDTRPLMPDVVAALEIAQPGTIVSIPK